MTGFLAGNNSRISRQLESSLALPRWHPSTMMRSKEIGGKIPCRDRGGARPFRWIDTSRNIARGCEPTSPPSILCRASPKAGRFCPSGHSRGSAVSKYNMRGFRVGSFLAFIWKTQTSSKFEKRHSVCRLPVAMVSSTRSALQNRLNGRGQSQIRYNSAVSLPEVRGRCEEASATVSSVNFSAARRRNHSSPGDEKFQRPRSMPGA